MTGTIGPALRTIHRLRKHIRDLEEELADEPRVLKIRQANLTKVEEAFKAEQDGIKKLQLLIREQESSLKAISAQLTKARKQLDDAANQKEYDAKKSEITNAEARINQLEDDTLTKLSEVEERIAKLPEWEAKVKAAKADAAQFENDAKARHARLVQELSESQAELRVAEEQIPPEIRGQYDRLVSSHGPDAFASAEGKSCGHCRTGLTNQLVHAVTHGLFACCGSCGRALYSKS